MCDVLSVLCCVFSVVCSLLPVEVEVALTFVGALNNAFLEQRDAGAVASRLKYSLRTACFNF